MPLLEQIKSFDDEKQKKSSFAKKFKKRFESFRAKDQLNRAAAVVAQLTERWILILKDPCLNPAISHNIDNFLSTV